MHGQEDLQRRNHELCFSTMEAEFCRKPVAGEVDWKGIFQNECHSAFMVGDNVTSTVAEVEDVFLPKICILCNICN